MTAGNFSNANLLDRGDCPFGDIEDALLDAYAKAFADVTQAKVAKEVGRSNFLSTLGETPLQRTIVGPYDSQDAEAVLRTDGPNKPAQKTSVKVHAIATGRRTDYEEEETHSAHLRGLERVRDDRIHDRLVYGSQTRPTRLPPQTEGIRVQQEERQSSRPFERPSIYEGQGKRQGRASNETTNSSNRGDSGEQSHGGQAVQRMWTYALRQDQVLVCRRPRSGTTQASRLQ
jgi:hypothetical protein